jgi:hypothetical protein
LFEAEEQRRHGGSCNFPTQKALTACWSRQRGCYYSYNNKRAEWNSSLQSLRVAVFRFLQTVLVILCVFVFTRFYLTKLDQSRDFFSQNQPFGPRTIKE